MVVDKFSFKILLLNVEKLIDLGILKRDDKVVTDLYLYDIVSDKLVNYLYRVDSKVAKYWDLVIADANRSKDGRYQLEER